jgi:hypothetical protein
VEEEMAGRLYSLCHVVGFWVALARFGLMRGSRFIFGLGLGGVFARAGWGLLHLPDLAQSPGLLFQSASGFTILFFPLGPLWLAPPGHREDARVSYWAGLGRSLPLGFAVARLGCIFSGCCGGWESESGWRHPAPLYEMLGWLCLGLLLERRPDREVLALFFMGFGGLRLLVEPFRAPPPLGATAFPVESFALLWLLAGVLLIREKYATSSGGSGAV